MRIRELRELKGVSRKQIADAVGVSDVAVYYWEIGRQKPSADKLPKLAELLGCSIDELFDQRPLGGTPGGEASA